MKEYMEAIQGMMAATTDHVTNSHGYFDWSLIYPLDKVKALGVCLDRAEALADTETLTGRMGS